MTAMRSAMRSIASPDRLSERPPSSVRRRLDAPVSPKPRVPTNAQSFERASGALPLMSMYVRVKRKRTTMFLHVSATETVLELKQKIQVRALARVILILRCLLT